MRHRALSRVVWAGAVFMLSGCATGGTPAPVYQVTTRKAAPPPLAPVVTAAIATPTPGMSGPPNLPPARSAIVGMPSTRVNVSANGSDLAQVIAGVARQAGLNPVIDPAIHGAITTTMQNV